MANTPITVAHGDGIGPEIMAASLHILKEAGAKIDIEEIEITPVDAAALVSKAAGAGLDVAKYESLYNFDGKAGYSLGRGQ